MPGINNIIDKGMRIIFITREGYNQPGARIRNYGFAKELAKKGLKTEVFSFVDNLGAGAGENDKGFTLRKKLRFSLKGLKELISKKNSVFVVSRFNYHSLPAWLASFIRNNPCVFDMDDWEAREDTGYYSNVIPKSKAEYLTRVFSRRAKLCIAASRYLRDYLARFNKKVYYLPTGVDLKIFKPALSFKNNNKVVFSWHGSINRKEILNYIEFMIECFLAINKKYPFTELWIKGKGMFVKEFFDLIKKYNNPGIKYIPWSPPQTISSYLDGIDVGLFPVLDKTRFNLAKSPVKVFEYMAKKKPVIASKLGEAGYIIKQGLNGFLAATKDEFIYYMEKLIKDPGLRQTLGENAHICVKTEYSLTVLGEKLYKIFLENFK